MRVQGGGGRLDGGDGACACDAQGIALTSVCPGYIRTAMTARNRFPMPGLMDADRAARIILRGVAAGRIRIVFPWWIGAAARVGALVPPRVVGAFMARLPAKQPLTPSDR